MKDIVAGLCFFLSGGAALIYEVCWIRKASLVFGSTSYALSTVLAVFFLGLAVGSYVFGRIGQRTEHPLRLFAVMELAVGVLALATPFAFEVLDTIYGAAYRAAGEQPFLLTLVRIFLVSVVLLPPTILMGGTLPLFCRQYVEREDRITRSVGVLYGINTLGAACGCAATGFLLLPALGTFGAICVGVLLDVVVALGAGFLGLRARLSIETARRRDQTEGSRVSPTVFALVFLIGFVALGNEVLWARHLALLVRNTVYTYTLSLTAVLIGIVLGSIAAALYFDRSRARAFWLGALQAATGVVTLGLMLIPAAFWAPLQPLPAATYFCLLVPAAMLSGAVFPLCVRLVVEDPALAGVGVGRLSAVNILGGIAGSLAVGFVCLPAFGQHATLLFTTALSVAGGVLAWVVLDRRSRPLARWSVASASVVAWVAVPIASGTRLPADFLVDRGRGESLVSYREGLSSNVAVLKRRSGVRALEIDGLWQGQDKKNHQVMAAHVPMLLRSDPRSVLVVGVGTGQAARRFLMYSIDRLDCVDIEPAVFDVIREYFDPGWMADARVRLLREDGRNYLAHTRERYDVISIEVGQIIRPGVPFFYTLEFYQRARERLSPEGFLVQFVPMPYFTLENFRSVVATFLAAFPQSFLWFNREELLLIGVKTPRLQLAGERLVLLREDPRGDNEVRHDLRITLIGDQRYGMHQLPVFLGSFLTGPSGLAELSSGAPLYRDERPVLDYAVPSVAKTDMNEIPIVTVLREHLNPIEMLLSVRVRPEDRAMVERIREKNLASLVDNARRRRLRNLPPGE